MKLKECYKKYGKSEELPHVMKDLEVQYILDNKLMKIAKKDNQVECLNCGNKQTLVIDKNIWQDIKGKFTVCEKCDSIYNIEYEVEY